MIPVVNEKYQYIFLYSAKAGCTSLRQLYLLIHDNELSEEQRGQLDWYHNLNEIHPYIEGKDYSDYFTFTVTRNPYSRIVSAYLDQFVYARNDGVSAMLAKYADATPDNFLQFLQFLKRVPDQERDTHFQSQAYFQYSDLVVTAAQSRRYRYLGKKPEGAFGVRYVADIAGFNQHMTKVYRKVFKGDKAKTHFAQQKISEIKKSNSSFYGEQDFDDAAALSVSELDALVFAPKPQDFLKSKQVIELIEEIYAKDFALFAYQKGDLPHKSVSPEVAEIPSDMDWQMYIRLNPDLTPDEVYNERGVIRHYLEFGRFEEHPRAYKIEAPKGFDWQRYLSLHSDLRHAGIDTEQAAIEHYISYGIREYRET